MPLSHDLKALSIWFDDVLDGGSEFTAEGARNFSRALDKAAADAEALEMALDAPAPTAEPDNVLPFRRPLRQALRASLELPFGDGDAA